MGKIRKSQCILWERYKLRKDWEDLRFTPQGDSWQRDSCHNQNQDKTKQKRANPGDRGNSDFHLPHY